MAAANGIDLDSDPHAIIGSRVFDAPRELVFAAFNDPKHLAQWWGPNGFSLTTQSFKSRLGDGRLFVMHRTGGPRVPEPHHLRGNRAARAHRLSS